ncbi:hypothetical protein PC118_g25945, partial [Phytophthora cactorum]
QYEFFAD